MLFGFCHSVAGTAESTLGGGGGGVSPPVDIGAGTMAGVLSGCGGSIASCLAGSDELSAGGSAGTSAGGTSAGVEEASGNVAASVEVEIESGGVLVGSVAGACPVESCEADGVLCSPIPLGEVVASVERACPVRFALSNGVGVASVIGVSVVVACPVRDEVSNGVESVGMSAGWSIKESTAGVSVVLESNGVIICESSQIWLSVFGSPGVGHGSTQLVLPSGILA